MNTIEKIVKFLSAYFPILVIGIATAAYYVSPPFKVIIPYIPQLLGVVMLGMGLTLTKDDFVAVFERPTDVVIGVALQFIIMPLLGLAIAVGMGHESGTCGRFYSGWLCSQRNRVQCDDFFGKRRCGAVCHS